MKKRRMSLYGRYYIADGDRFNCFIGVYEENGATKTVAVFANKILNIHPSLLLRHGGKGLYGDKVHEAVLKSGDKQSGATVQFINNEYDAGPIVLQKK